MTTDKLKKYVLPNLPYLLIFWFANKLGWAYRLAPGANFGSKLTGSVSNLNFAFGDPLPSFVPFDLMAGIAGAALVYAIVYLRGKNAKKYRKGVEYGSARWGGAKDIQPFMDAKPENNIILTQTEGLTMSSRPKNPKYARNKNVLIVGGSGSGKTRFIIKPNERDYHRPLRRGHAGACAGRLLSAGIGSARWVQAGQRPPCVPYKIRRNQGDYRHQQSGSRHHRDTPAHQEIRERQGPFRGGVRYL